MAIPALTSPFGALSLVVRIGAIGVAISALESLRRPANLGPAGLLDGAAQLTRARWLLPFAFLASPALAVALTWVRLVAAVAVIAGGANFEVARVGVIAIALATHLLRFRNPLGIHASGTMVMVIFTAAALGLAAGTRLSLVFTLWFIAAQACLAYFVAGASKLQGASWRTGKAIPLISSTLMWGNRPQAVMLRSHHRLALALCWATMVGECAFPLALAVPLPLTIVLLSCTGVFHVLTAIEMGLNSFVWAYGSTYPAIIFCWYWLHGVRV